MREISIEEQAFNTDNLTFGDDRLGVVFYNKVVEDREATQKEGRKIFKNREYVKILVPGDRHNIIDRPVQRTGILPTDDIMRFPTQYARFKQNEEQKEHDGTPLILWPQMPATLAEELKYLNIFTVEQLALLSDVHLAKFHGGHQWKAKAAAFVSALHDQEEVNKLNAALGERDSQIDALKQAVAEQAAQIKELQKKVK